MVIIYILGVVLLLVILSKLVKQKKTQSENCTDLHKYFLGELTLNELGNINKPILWIHVPAEYNSRHWESFGSRSSFKLNQPYLYLTTQLIINKCMDSFHVVLFDDKSFSKLLPKWSYTNSTITPMVRLYGFLEILYMYGGMITPISFICFSDLIKLYHEGTRNNSMFVCENLNYDTTYNYTMIPDPFFMGAYKGTPELAKLFQFIQQNIISAFTYSEPSSNKLEELLITEISNKNINLIPGYAVGTQNSKLQPITVDDLMSYTELSLHTDVYGIWIPHKQILKRIKYQWFARLSERQLEQSQIIICKYLINAYRSTTNYIPCNTLGTQSDNPIIPTQVPQLVTMWDTPLLSDGIYGLKPLYLGDPVLTVDQ